MVLKPAKKSTPKRKAAAKPDKRKVKAKATTSGNKFDPIRIDLERQRAVLLEEAAAFTGQPDQGGFPDLTDQASAEVDQSFSIRLREREQRLLKKINEALERIEDHTYGICESCGENIPFQRLKARPVTTLCIECKTLQEEEEKIRG